MPSLKVAVQLAPWLQERVRNVAQLKDQLVAEGLDPANIAICPDQNRDPMRAFIGTLSALGESAGLVMEDDVLLCPGFLERAQVRERFESMKRSARVQLPWVHDDVIAKQLLKQILRRDYYPEGAFGQFVLNQKGKKFNQDNGK